MGDVPTDKCNYDFGGGVIYRERITTFYGKSFTVELVHTPPQSSLQGAEINCVPFYDDMHL